MTTEKIRVPVEVDVTYVNKSWYTGKKKIDNSKHYVIGFFQREGNAIIKALPNNNPETIQAAVLENVSKGSVLYCEIDILPEDLVDSYDIYELKPADCYAVGDFHINNVKNMWRDLKRNIKREHVQVSKKYLQLYCNEVAWRINTRHQTAWERFDDLISLAALTPKTTLNDFVKKDHL